ncbi:3-hydroxy-3-methylglutaryl-ACP synthase [Streptomyces sp. NBC_01485]|uniref:hydroxymethylglutaryl-CoA synthase family protein n=1 Tax=Streptomyces sp. NBC_01485 TaxID=2903884 RepID=UPI002E32EB3A|nr:hydroxymethylglutaryl-CoA synthase [Streptomyces sp. NBC_01485]
MTTATDGAPRVGIEALNVHAGLARLSTRDLFEGRGLDMDRLGHLMMDARSIALPCEDPVTNAVNAAAPIVAATGEDRDRIELILTSSESGVDYSKSIASYVHEYLGLSRHCRVMEVKQACYAATGALQIAAGYIASGLSPGAKALVIATDVSMVDARADYAEPATGTGAAAMLVGDDPKVLALDLGAFGTYSYETMDSARPLPDHDIADVDGSLFAYLDCLSQSFSDYCGKVAGADLRTTFDQLALHTPFAGLVKAGHRKLMREARAPAEEIEEDFTARLRPSLVYPSVVGNLCSGSVYLALASIIDHAPYRGSARVGLFSYGSGCASEFFSGLIDEGSRAEMARMGIAARLDARVALSFAEYAELLAENSRCLVPVPDRKIEVERFQRFFEARPGRERLLVYRGVEGYHRRYEWVEEETNR